jgi:AraC-like DNA-binding protein
MKAQLEVLLPDQNTSFRAISIADKRFRHAIHYHPELELTYIAKGCGTRITGDSVEPFCAGDLCLFGPNLPHCYYQASSYAEGAAAEVLQFSRECGGGIIDRASEWVPASLLLDRSDCGLRFSNKTADKVFPLMLQLRQASGLQRWQCFIAILTLLLACDKVETLASPAHKTVSNPRHANRIQKACNFMLERFSEPIRHQDIAAHVHLAPASLSRLFRHQTGQTCADFLTSVRLGNACRLLRETDLTVTEIAYACGFQNLSNFHRRFRDKYKINPIRYRRLTPE